MKYLNPILKIINLKNINEGISTFNKAVQDFGNSMDSMTRELSTDIEKSNDASKIREQRNTTTYCRRMDFISTI